MLIDGVQDYALYMLDPQGYVCSWNSGAQRIKGYTADEILGQHFSRFFTEEDRLCGEPARALAVAGAEGRREQEGWRVRKDGSRFWANTIIDAIRDHNGRLLGFAKITRDITERRQASEALEQARARLVQAQKMEAIGNLTGGIAHDFNNMLAVIINSLDLLALKMRGSPDLVFVEKAQQAAERGANLTRQLLAYARRQPLKPNRLDLNALITNFDSILRRACPESVSFELRLAPTLHGVLLDGQQLETALLNLVVNARDAMPDGGTISIITENVRFSRRDAPGCLGPGAYVRVALTDTGHGIPEEALQHAFEPFFTTKEAGKGSGLGLSQVYGFVAQSGGEATIDTGVGKGTTLNLYFPALEPEAPPAQSDGKALIVEDDADLREVTAEIFRGMDYEVLTAADSAEAAEILKRVQDLDVMFADATPALGSQILELARMARERCPQARIILTSGYPLPPWSNDQSLPDGAAFIRKPFRWTELLEKVRAAKKT